MGTERDPTCGNCGVRLADLTTGCEICNQQNREAARQRILQVIPHLRYSIKEAEKHFSGEGKVEIGILAVAHDGYGKVISRFSANEFLEDLATVVCAGPQTKDNELEARARQIIDTQTL
jgi:hypothetical protein